MTVLTRRQFSSLTGAALLAPLAPRIARAQGKPRVVVIGGGIGGATVARYLAGTAAIDVTLVEPKRRYVTCFFSSLYLAGLRSLNSLSHGYETLAQQYSVKVVPDRATAIDPAAKTVATEGAGKLPYDRLVLAPGVAFKFDGIEGYDEAASKIMPHAWNAGPQSELLRRQIESMEDGGVFVIVAPPDPFRCPPAPYERASLIAYYFKQYKPRSKILILDAKDRFSGQELFQDAWARYYPGMIEWLPAQFTGGVTAVDAKARWVVTAGETFKAAVANVIPAQMAGDLARQSGLADASGWCPVNPVSFESTLLPDIHLVGDAIIGGDMPKSGFSANSQAKACAFAIAASLTGSERFPPHLFNSCYTFLAPDDAFTNAINFAPDGGKIKTVNSFISKVGESAESRRRIAHQAVGWYAAFSQDVFG
ncbi:MAG: NAD(P)/FAD-dependent oxidoreductase [Hyphomicrobiales bacterium]|nr:NAD(P)/FAD-dependent oxidoreductase [Hyphomicrobiales bacterium]